MGVPGLYKYVSDNSDLYLKPFELCDTYLVVDGANVACRLYISCTKGDSVFGGDYDEYHIVVREFFLSLKKCNVTPIVMLDGGHEWKKLKTVKKRLDSKLEFLELFNRCYSDKKFFPIFLTTAFVDVMEEMEIITMRSDLEADVEIASVAKALNCPVLSEDSDFYIFDVLYVPFSFLYLDPICIKSSEKEKKYHMKCFMFDRMSFVNKFEGLDKSHLPILVALLGNDYIDSDVFKLFFKHVIIPRDQRSFNQRKIEGVLNWLKKENVDSAIKGILKHIRVKDAQKVLRVINSTIKGYNKILFSSFVHKEISKLLDSKMENLVLGKPKDLIIGWPSEIDSLFHNCRLSMYIMDMIMLGIYFTHIQVGDYESDSTHSAASNLIKAIHAIIRQYVKKDLKLLTVYVVHKKKYLAVQFNGDFCPVLKDLNLREILNESKNSKVQLLFDILDFSKDDIETLSKFTETWYIYLMAVIYWIKSLNDSSVPFFSHVNALLLLAIANQVVQKSVGFYESCSLLLKKHRKFLNKFKDSEVKVAVDAKDFKQMLDNVTKYECFLIQKSLIPLRHTTDDGKGHCYSICTIRLFNSFQSCLSHIMEINALLNYPFPHLRISDFFSGTLLFNLFLNIQKARQSGGDFGDKLLKPAPNVGKIYFHLIDNFNKYCSNEPVRIHKKHKRKRSNKKSLKKSSEFIVCDEQEFCSDDNDNSDNDNDDNNYSDKVNHFWLLKPD